MDNTTTPISHHGVRNGFAILREQREPQLQMGEMVIDAILNRKNIIVEAGTGTGKSFGYLIPVVFNAKKAIVSTFTLALQEQLMRSDIPFLQKSMRERFGIRFSAAMLKGASNYACIRRVDEVDAALPQEIIDWQLCTTTGDLAEAPDMDAETREAIRIDLDDCPKDKCPFFESCFYRQAKARARAADVLIVNHKLLAMGLENPFLLDLSGFDVAIIDEAHQWEDVARESFGGRLSPTSLAKFFKAVEKELVDSRTVQDENGKAHAQQEPAWTERRDAFRKAWAEVIAPWLPTTHPDGSPFDDEKLLVPVEVIRARSEKAAEAFSAISMWVRERLQDKAEHNRIDRQIDGIKGFFTSIKAGDVITVAARKVRPDATMAQVAMETFPLMVGGRLKSNLYPMLPTVYTSATISAGGDFTLAKDALGLALDTQTAEIGSPFNYPEQSLLYVPRGGFDPRDQGYMGAFNREVETLLQISQGRAFVLFTSNRAMRDAYERRRHDFPTRWQEPGANKNALISWFKETPNAVLYATASFWEGVSIEGEQLSLVIIDKIPFPPPSDPIYKAKGALLPGQKEFFALSVPSAIIKLKQGFGRLVRTQSDRGMVAILDSRIMGKGYGRTILNALPPARLIHDLSDRALIDRYLAPGEPDQFTHADELIAPEAIATQPAPIAELPPKRTIQELADTFWPEVAF